MSIQLIQILVVGFLLGCGSSKSSSLKERWNVINNPENLLPSYETTFQNLPLNAALEVKPWADSYWPSYKGGVSFRWRTSELGFDYDPPSLEALRNMSPNDIASLSPAEKYDIYRGRFDYPLVKLERMRTSPANKSWEGLCHGWAVAAMHYKEPKSVVVKSKDKIEIPFGATDIKALLTYLDAEWSQASERSLGARCNEDLTKNPSASNKAACRDVNAGAFHVVLANQIGLRKKSFVADVTRDQEVWNHPVFAYESRVIGERHPRLGDALGTVKVKKIETSMSYRVENEPSWDNVASDEMTATKVYTYEVEIDLLGRIIGGTWISADRPDFLWIKEAATFEGPFKEIGELYRLSIKSKGTAEPGA